MVASHSAGSRMGVRHWLPLHIYEKQDVYASAEEVGMTRKHFAWYSVRLSTEAYRHGLLRGRTELLDIHNRLVPVPDVSDEAIGLLPDTHLLLSFSELQRKQSAIQAETQELSIDEFLRRSLRVAVFAVANADQPYTFIHQSQEHVLLG